MSKQPYMKLWCSDFLGDTLHLSQAEIGQYMLILMAMWNNGGSLPKEKLRTCARGKISSDVMAFFDIEDGVVTNKRLTTEVKNAQEFSDSQRAKANAKHLKDKERACAGADAPEMPTIAIASKDSSESQNLNGESVDGGFYAFKGHVIKLKTGDYAVWQKAYQRLDLAAELLAYDAYLVNQGVKKDWFARTSKYLANRNSEAKVKGEVLAKPKPERLSPFMQATKEHIEELEARHEERTDVEEGRPGRRAIRGASSACDLVPVHAEAAGLQGDAGTFDQGFDWPAQAYRDPDG